ncbi:Apurinic/apyrimidinic endonuclease and related enzymes [Phaffia rhodozyma]|uniref:DNA-(apurinic or apyrimidinic site) endonuclease n=1 Tax=Phaffia rhodozyma TaxID=264483 RepID=A0A0F7SNW1_PHARH|nr:Apurinic/apyrimidinic endonuclease and related enzymes [Phaffia rhodozyma]
MKIITWNVNGLKTLMNYSPWYALKTYDAVLKELEADILCVQELKIPRSNLTKAQACPPGYDAFLSFPHSGKGYSGVGVYTSQSVVVPHKASEGITGLSISPKDPSSSVPTSSPSSLPLPADDHVLPYPDVSSIPLFKTEPTPERPNPPPEQPLWKLDVEGRSLTLDLGMFILINVYCPNETNEDRLPFKLNFLTVLEARVKELVKNGREVMVVGDMNVVHRPSDHGEGTLASKQNGFWDHPARQWFDQFLEPKGIMTDIVRSAFPEREKMFTCWNTKIDARASNYGTRLDYILVTKGLLPWVKSCDILPDIRGSDHCPVYVDLHESLPPLSPEEKPRLLADMLNVPFQPSISISTLKANSSSERSDQEGEEQARNVKVVGKPREDGTRVANEPPKLATMFYPEFSAKSIKSFFQPVQKVAPSKAPATATDKVNDQIVVVDLTDESDELMAPRSIPAKPQRPSSQTLPAPIPTSTASKQHQKAWGDIKPTETRPKIQNRTKSSPIKPNGGQTSLVSFFAPSTPSSTPPTASTLAFKKRRSSPPHSISPDKKLKRPRSDSDEPDAKHTSAERSEPDEAADRAYALQLAQEEEQAFAKETESNTDPKIDPDSGEPAPSAAQLWTGLLKKVEPPRCRVHQAPCVERTVTKQGPNKGKKFWLCSLPLGPGHDSGGKKNGRLREEVNLEYKCDYFIWGTDARKQNAEK